MPLQMRFPSYLVVLLATAYAASWVDHTGTLLDGFIFNGIVSGLFALLGVVLGIFDESIPKRLSFVLLGAVGLCAIFLLRPQFNGWELLLSVVRLVLLCLFFGILRARRNVVFTSRRPSQLTGWGNLKLWHLFGFTSIVAMFLAFVRFLKDYDGPGGEIFTIAVIVIVAIFAATIPLMAAYATIGQRDFLHGIPFALLVVMIAACIGIFSYSQTDDLRTGLQWSVNSIVEALTLTVALLLLRLRGYHLSWLQPDSSIRRAEHSV